MKHKYDRDGSCLKSGLNTESKFIESLEKFSDNFKYIRDANFYENTTEHWDQLYLCREQEVRIEIKGMKSLKRGMSKQDEYVLLEVHGGGLARNLGWIYGSKANIVALERKHDFCLFYLDDLINFVDNSGIKEQEPVVREGQVEYYKLYKREMNGKDRLDRFFWVPFEDLIKTTKLLQVPKVN